jgi:hypothetical protein
VGKSLVRARDWTHLTVSIGFTTEADEGSYPLPSGYDRIRDGTVWNYTTGLQMGPVHTTIAVAEITGRADTAPRSPMPYRIKGNRFLIEPVPASAEVIFLDIISGFWVMPTGQTSPTTLTPTAATDTLWFDENLLVRGLKLAYLRAKGFDTSHAQDEFNQAYDAAAGSDGAASPISVLGGTSRRLAMGSPPGDNGEWGT